MAKKKEQFDRHGYSLSPQNVSNEFWFYEEPKGLCCIYQPRAKNGTLLFNAPAWYIPWRFVERSIRRRQDAKKKRRSRGHAA
jgi:hypothetical protein